MAASNGALTASPPISADLLQSICELEAAIPQRAPSYAEVLRGTLEGARLCAALFTAAQAALSSAQPRSVSVHWLDTVRRHCELTTTRLRQFEHLADRDRRAEVLAIQRDVMLMVMILVGDSEQNDVCGRGLCAASNVEPSLMQPLQQWLKTDFTVWAATEDAAGWRWCRAVVISFEGQKDKFAAHARWPHVAGRQRALPAPVASDSQSCGSSASSPESVDAGDASRRSLTARLDQASGGACAPGSTPLRDASAFTALRSFAKSARVSTSASDRSPSEELLCGVADVFDTTLPTNEIALKSLFVASFADAYARLSPAVLGLDNTTDKRAWLIDAFDSVWRVSKPVWIVLRALGADASSAGDGDGDAVAKALPPAAFLVYTSLAKHKYYIEQVAVDVQWQRRGAGRRLLWEFARRAGHNEPVTVVGHARRVNTMALLFYKSVLGAREEQPGANERYDAATYVKFSATVVVAPPSGDQFATRTLGDLVAVFNDIQERHEGARLIASLPFNGALVIDVFSVHQLPRSFGSTKHRTTLPSTTHTSALHALWQHNFMVTALRQSSDCQCVDVVCTRQQAGKPARLGQPPCEWRDASTRPSY